MKILHINNFFTKEGGAEKVMYETALLFKEKGHEIFFFATDKQPYFEKNYEYAVFFPKFIDYSAISKIQRIKHLFRPFYNFEAEKKLDKYIKKIKPDIVHCHNIYYHLTPSVLNICKKHKIPTVMTIHDIRLMCPACTLLFKADNYCEKELCIGGNPMHCVINCCKDKNLIASYVVAFENCFKTIHKLYDNISCFICTTNPVLELAERAGIKKQKLALIPLFLNNKYFEISSDFSNKGYLLYCGRIIKDKGLDFLLQTMAKLPDIKLHIVGTGDEKTNLEKLKQDLNLDNVEFFNYLSGKELEEQYKNCLATIMPSKLFETFGLSSLESFAYGKPVIANKRGGISDIVNEKNGIFYEYGNTKSLLNAIKMLHKTPELAVKMGANGRFFAETIFNSKQYYNNLINLYKIVIQGKIHE